ncbi:MAG: hypothetical protein ACLP1Q_00605 [Solirubrobacteraceae bacterium]
MIPSAGTMPAWAATGVPAWPAASELTLPSGADRARGAQAANLASVACTSPVSCTAVGSYTDASKSSQAMVAAETSGVWGQASELTLPSGANTTAGQQNAELDSIACTSVGACVAVGSYTDANGAKDHQALIVTETGGVWGQASELMLPTGAIAAAGAQNAQLDSVTCTSPGNCVAAGSYTDTGSSSQAMVATETGGVWGQASELTLPSNANTTAGAQNARLDSLTCTGPGSCVAVGYYAVTGGGQQAMVVTETGGTWGQPSEFALPTNALGVGPLYPAGAQCDGATCLQAAKLDSVACASVGNCTAVGEFADDSIECVEEASPDSCGVVHEAMAATETNGAWQPTVSVGASNTRIALSELESVACTGPGSCAGVGQQAFVEAFMEGATYEDHPAMLAAETGGVWGHVSAATLPPGAAPFQQPPSFTPTPGGPEGPEEDANLDSLACSSPGDCVAVGSYTATDGSTQAMVLSSVPSLALLTKQTISSRRHSAKFSFTAEGEASGFQCALVRVTRGRHKRAPAPRYSSCRTPKRYTKLTPGVYVFYVRTVGPGGIEETPAKHRFTIH